jgi:preprotein translocase subunit YajC
VLLAGDSASGGGNSLGLIMIVLLIGAMYFIMIRPNSKRRKDAMQMQSSLAPGDEVMTGSGFFGTVTAMDDDTVTLEVSPGVNVKVARAAIGRVIPRDVPGSAVDEADSEKSAEQA